MKKFVLLLLIAVIAFASYSSPPSKPKVKPPNKTKYQAEMSKMLQEHLNIIVGLYVKGELSDQKFIERINTWCMVRDAVMLDDNGLCQCDHLLIKPITAVQTETTRPATYQQIGYSMAY